MSNEWTEFPTSQESLMINHKLYPSLFPKPFPCVQSNFSQYIETKVQNELAMNMNMTVVNTTNANIESTTAAVNNSNLSYRYTNLLSDPNKEDSERNRYYY